MRNFILTFFLCFIALSASAQYGYDDYFSSYEPVYGNSYQQTPDVPAQAVYGYVPTSNGWVRVTLRVKETNTGIIVVGYKKKDTSAYSEYYSTYDPSPSPWRQCQAWARPVTVASDGRDIAKTFDYKVAISGIGNVYF